jgi:subtilisin family serine protease
MTQPRSRLPSSVRRSTLLIGFTLIAAIFPAAVAAADPPTPEAADQVVVRYRAGTTESERQGVAHAYGLTKIRGSANGRTEVLVAKGKSPATARRQLAADPNVVAVSPNSWRDLDADPTAETYFTDLWGMNNIGQAVDNVTGVPDVDIDGLEALQHAQGRSDIVVAVIDDGVDFTRPDLADAAWINDAEFNGTPGFDDDHNGYVDDVYGWNFCENNAAVGPAGDDWHGTHVAGTIAASLNGQGIVGVAPGVRIMALRTFVNHSSCDAGDAAIIEAIDYAAARGVPIINASWGGSQPSAALEAAISDAQDTTLLMAAAGNGDLEGNGVNIDVPGGPRFYPASSTLPNVLTVAAITQSGYLATFSNYGALSVDISAPGTNILSVVPSGYAWADGTSMATPHVSGVAALALSATSGTLTPAQLKSRVLSTGVPLARTAGKTFTGRLVNALRAIDFSGPTAKPIDRYGINVGSIIGTGVSTTMVWPAATDTLSGVASYLIRRSLNGGSSAVLASSVTTRSYKVAMTFGTRNRFQLFARDRAGNLGPGALGPTVTASLVQDGTSLAKYSASWSTVAISSASNGKLHRSSTNGASVEFRTTARAMAIVGRRGPLNGKARVYVDGHLFATIDLRKSTTQSKVVVFNTSWTTAAVHSVKLVVIGGTGRVEVDAFAFLR